MISIFPYLFLETYLLWYDYPWHNIIFTLFIILSILFYKDSHPSRIIVYTTMFGYMLCPNNLYDVLATVLYIYKYSPENIDKIYGSIIVLSIVKSVYISICKMKLFVALVKILSILFCIETFTILECMKNKTMITSRLISYFRNRSGKRSSKKMIKYRIIMYMHTSMVLYILLSSH